MTPKKAAKKTGSRTRRKPSARAGVRLASKPGWQEKFLAAFAERANVRAACRAAGVSRQLAYETRKTDAEFARKWRTTRADAVDLLEEEAWRRAHDGTKKPVYQGGALVGTVREYSDTLIIFLLKAHRPKKYRDNFKHEHSGQVNVGLPGIEAAIERIYGTHDGAGDGASATSANNAAQSD